MVPDTWLPTWTVTMAESVPVAVTLPTMRPRLTGAVYACVALPAVPWPGPVPAGILPGSLARATEAHPE